MRLESILLLLLVTYGVLIEAKIRSGASHVHLLRNSVHTLALEGESAGQDAERSRFLERLHIMAPGDILGEAASTREGATQPLPLHPQP